MVFACKHFSRWDPLVVGFAIPQPLYFMTDINQFQGLQCWLIENLGGFPVDRTKPDKSSLKTTLDILTQGKRLVIFPEGDIHREQKLAPLKPGLARIVLQAESITRSSIPILPVALNYSPDAIARAEISVAIDRPLFSNQHPGENTKLIAQSITQELETRLASLLQTPKKHSTPTPQTED